MKNEWHETLDFLNAGHAFGSGEYKITNLSSGASTMIINYLQINTDSSKGHLAGRKLCIIILKRQIPWQCVIQCKLAKLQEHMQLICPFFCFLYISSEDLISYNIRFTHCPYRLHLVTCHLLVLKTYNFVCSAALIIILKDSK